MNGAAHYAEAERLMAKAGETYGPDGRLPRWTPEGIAAMVAQAQVHADLARTAALVQSAAERRINEVPSSEVWDPWLEAIS